MKKLTEELNRYNFINNYVSEQFRGKLNEEESGIERLYRNIFTNVTGPGTRLSGTSGLLAWIKSIKSYDEFKQLDDMIRKNKEYTNFENLINSEFESNNSDEIMEVIKHLRSIGVNNGHPGTAKQYNKGTYKVLGPLTTKPKVATPVVSNIKTPVTTVGSKVKVSPTLQKTMGINKQIQQKSGLPQTGKLTHNDLEKLIKLLRPAETSVGNELKPTGLVTPAQTAPVAQT